MVKQYNEGDELPPITPGDLLLHEYMEPCGLSMNALARALHVSPTAISEIVRGQRAISTVMAKRLSLFFGNSIQMWLNMQQHYEVKLIERQIGKALKKEITPFDYSTLSKDTSSMVCESHESNQKKRKTTDLTYSTRQKKTTATSNKTSSGTRNSVRKKY